MAYKYIYVDDLQDGNQKGIINGIQSGGKIEIEFRQPKEWDELIEELLDLIPNYDGLILDLRLNDNPNNEGYTAQFRGSTLAQELRTLVKETSIKKDFPILLITANENIDISLDETGKDLFDAVINKSTLDVEEYGILRKRLISLAKGYGFLNNNENKIETILQISNSSILDGRFIETVSRILEAGHPKHIIARFILKEVLEKPSFLIDENFLSARLGVDITSEKWTELKSGVLKECLYEGVFSDYYIRWWMPLVEEWWKNEITDEVLLRSSTSALRVDLLNEKLELNLDPIQKLKESKSSSFWTICKATKKAIDNIDGFLITNQDDIFPWQEKEYVSISEALRPTLLDVWKGVSSSEKNRLQLLKDYFNETAGERK